MKIRLLVALVALTIGFAVPSIAQDKNTIDPDVQQQVEAAYNKFCEAHNKHDAAAMAALYTQDGVKIESFESEGGLTSGQQAIEKMYATDFASSPPEFVGKLVHIYPIGNEICAISEWREAMGSGYKAMIYVRDADTWKIRLEYVNVSALQ